MNLSPGIHRQTLALDDDRLLRYTVAVPDVAPGTPVPLVLALHYAGTITPFFAEPYLRDLVEPAFRHLGAILIAPDAPGPSWVDADALVAMEALVGWAKTHWPVDPARVAVTGYSMGGIGTWFLAGLRPDLFSAGIPVAAHPIDKLDHAAPFYAIHGRADELFPADRVEHIIETLRGQGASIEFVVVEGLSHYTVVQYVDALRRAADWLAHTVWGLP